MTFDLCLHCLLKPFTPNTLMKLIHIQGNIFASLLKSVFSKRKEFLPLGTNSFLLEKTPFQKGLGVQESKQESQNCLLSKNCRKLTKCIQSSLCKYEPCHAKICLRTYANLCSQCPLMKSLDTTECINVEPRPR